MAILRIDVDGEFEGRRRWRVWGSTSMASLGVDVDGEFEGRQRAMKKEEGE